MSWWKFWQGGKGRKEQEGETRPGGLEISREQLAAIHQEQQETGKTGEQTVRAEGQEVSGEQLLEYQKLQQLLGGINANTTTPQSLRKPLTPSLVPVVGSSLVGGGKVNQGQGMGNTNTTFSESVGSGNQTAEDWFNKGNEQFFSGNFQGAIASYDRAIEIRPDNHEALWFIRSLVLMSLSRYEEAVVSYDKAIEINPDNHKAWFNRGLALGNLGRHEEAITSYYKALEIKPYNHDAWYGWGLALGNLGRYEEAITSYDKVIEIKTDFHEAWFNRGNNLVNLGMNTEAIASYDRAIEIKTDYHEAWFNRGNSLNDLGRYEEAIASYDKALEIKPDKHEAWINRGNAVSNLSRNYRAALGRPLIYSVQNPAIDQCGYSGKVANYCQGLEFCQQDTHPEGWGELHWYLGWAHYLQGKKQEAPFRLFREARREYELALTTLTAEAFPETHLEVLQDYLKVYRALEPGKIEKVLEICQQGSELLNKLIKLNPSRKESLQRQFIGFGQITVDVLLQSEQVVQALEQIEKSKAVCLDWMLPPREPLTWTEMQTQMLDPAVALIYWYYSPLALHTILLLPQQPPQLIATTPVDALEKFLTTWNEQYSNYTGKNKTSQDQTWQQELPNHLINLAEILSIEKILPILQEHHIQNLTLIPHRDLHRLPLHALGFPPQIKIRYLPTLHLGSPLPPLKSGVSLEVSLLKKDLEKTSGQERWLLSVEAPDSISLDENEKSLGNLSYAALESAYICQSIGEPLHRIANTAATKDAVSQALHQGCQIFHFSGHAGYNFNEPVKSALCLSQKDRLNIADILQIPLNGCQLVCLSACETGITSKDGITTEYVGLVSAFLAQGVNTVVSTLWQVKSESSAIITIEFYRRLYHPENPQDKITALHETTHWLRTATVQDLITWNEALQAEAPPRNVVKFLKAQIINWSTLEKTDQPYSDPYHWAAFTITGG